ncbi:MAG TPA: rhomboid family intramembrane serine protease [Acidobacteriaceae bacterium]|nr:rhomboid family intramembrane serine protease [Acidobacteriaceae bacterium]
MPRSAGMLMFPDFSGFTRKVILWNLGAYFALLLLGVASRVTQLEVILWTALVPPTVLHGAIWQLISYSFVQLGIWNVAFALLSLWFLGSFLEGIHGARWLAELYFTSVVGAGLAGMALYAVMPASTTMLTGCWGGIFGLLIAFGVLYGEQQFMMFPFPIMIKAKYLVWVYMLISLAMLFSSERGFAFSQLGGALFGYLYIKYAPRRGFAFAGSEQYFGLRNSYYRWKRRRAARKFEVYMKKQNREVRFDDEGRYIDPDDKSKWN